MGTRAKVVHRAMAGSVARRIDDLRAEQGLSRWKLWRSMQACGYAGGRQAVYRALNGGVGPSVAFLVAASMALGTGAEDLLFGAPNEGIAGGTERYLETTLVARGRSPRHAKVEARAGVAAGQDRKFRKALRATLAGVLPTPDAARVRLYSTAAAEGIHNVLSARGRDSLVDERVNAIVGFARSVFLLGLAEDKGQFRELVRAATKHLVHAESVWVPLVASAGAQGSSDLAVVTAQWRASYHQFASETLGALLSLPSREAFVLKND